MLLNIGVGSNAGVYSENGGPFYAMRDFFGALTPSLAKTNMGSGYSAMVLSVVTMFVGLFAIVVLTQRGVKGAVLLGMLISSIIYWAGEAIFLGTNPFASLATASFVPAFGDMASTTLFKFDFRGFAEIGWFTAITLIITFCIIDMFDTIGTLVGVSNKARMLVNGKVPRAKQAFMADAIGTTVGAMLGTNTVSTFVESASGIAQGGRSGITSFVTAICFGIALLFAPLFLSIPSAATCPILVLVGLFMMSPIKDIDLDDFTESVPAFICIIMIPMAYSISDGIVLGLISYVLTNLCLLYTSPSPRDS